MRAVTQVPPTCRTADIASTSSVHSTTMPPWAEPWLLVPAGWTRWRFSMHVSLTVGISVRRAERADAFDRSAGYTSPATAVCIASLS